LSNLLGKVEFKDVKEKLAEIKAKAINSDTALQEFERWLDHNDYVNINSVKCDPKTIKEVVKTSKLRLKVISHSCWRTVFILRKDVPKFHREIKEYRVYHKEWR